MPGNGSIGGGQSIKFDFTIDNGNPQKGRWNAIETGIGDSQGNVDVDIKLPGQGQSWQKYTLTAGHRLEIRWPSQLPAAKKP